MLTFGEGNNAPAIAVTLRDVRCAILNFDPDSASASPEVLKGLFVRTRTSRVSTAETGETKDSSDVRRNVKGTSDLAA